MSDQTTIAFHNVHRHFDNIEVLAGLDLQVRPGEIHALLGRNGSGKTTALRILLGFLTPHHGHSEILGVRSDQLTPENRGSIGYVTEGHRLYPGMRVRDVLAFEAGTRSEFDLTLARQATKRCELPEKNMVAQLSRGQRAQLSLIIAVASRPKVLICDDPALGLDVVMRRELLDVMIELLSDQGISVLFSSHFLTDVERIADRISILHEGRLIVDATLDDLKQRVQKRFWQPPSRANGLTAPQVPGLLRARKRRTGFELTLLDLDHESEQHLRQNDSHLGEAVVPGLEDLFLDLTRPEGPRILQTSAEEEA